MIEYNTKLRSADTVVDLLLSICNSQTFNRTSASYPDLRTTAASSALLHPAFLDRLSTFVHGFTTPGQISKLIECVPRYLRAASEPLDEQGSSSRAQDDSPGPRKKRKTGKHTLPASTGLERSAISFTLTSGLASVILTSIPLHLLQTDDRREAVEVVQHYYNDTQSALKSAAKHIRFTGSAESWSHQTLVASMLRLRYALSSDRKLQLATDIDTKLIPKLTPLLEMDALLPHLRIEIVSSYVYVSLRHALILSVDPVLVA